MDVEFIILNDVSCSLTHLIQRENGCYQQFFMILYDIQYTNPHILKKMSHCVQDLQESEGRVQETGENSLLFWGNSHFVHSKQIHHHFLVQLDQPLEDSGLKRSPPVSWHKYNIKHFVKEGLGLLSEILLHHVWPEVYRNILHPT